MHITAIILSKWPIHFCSFQESIHIQIGWDPFIDQWFRTIHYDEHTDIIMTLYDSLPVSGMKQKMCDELLLLKHSFHFI